MVGNKRRGPGKAAGFLLAVAASVLLVSSWTGVASAATGKIEICKKGAAGVTFNFTVQKGLQTPQTVQATGGSISCASVTVPTGTIKITEDTTGSDGLVYSQTNATTVPESAFVSENPGTATTKVSVTAGDDIVVNVFNTLGVSSVKICKTSGTAAFNNKIFTFTVAGQSVSAHANGDCSNPVNIPAQSVIIVSENVPDTANWQVTSINVTAGQGTIRRHISSSSIRFVVGNGVNVLTFNNEATAPPQNGLLEICKDAGDQFITGSYNFTIAAAGVPNQTATVPVTQCTTPLTVPAGNVTVTEDVPANQQLTNVFLGLNSAGSLGTVIKANGSAVVVVPIASAGDVQVHFVNSSNTTQLKICKLLPAGSEALQGTAFTFDTTDDSFANGTTFTTSVTVPKGASSACTIVTDSLGHIVSFPVGSTATTTERNTRQFVDAGNGVAKPSKPVNTTINAGINEADFTNTAMGVIEICKHIVAPDPDYHQTFTFTYQNVNVKSIKGTLTTISGSCSFPKNVPAGTYTIAEDLSGNTVTLADGTKLPAYQFVASDVRDNSGNSLCVPAATYPAPAPSGNPAPPPNGGCGNPIQTVTVPYAGNAASGEAKVDFWNRLVHGTAKICKVVDPNSSASIGHQPYTFTASSTVNGVTTTYGPFTINPPYTTCEPFGDFPLMNENGTAVTVTVTEVLGAAYEPQSITVTPGVPVAGSPNLATGTITFNPATGLNTVTFVNTSRCSGADGDIPAGVPGTVAFYNASQPAIAAGCAVYVDLGNSNLGPTSLGLEFIRGPNLGTQIVIGPESLNGVPVSLTDSALDSSGKLYGVDLNQGFYRIDPVTGALTLVNSNDGMAAGPTSLVVGPPGDTIYAVQGGGYFDTINPTTGVASCVAGCRVPGAQGDIAFVGSKLFESANDFNIYTLNTTTAAATLVGPFGLYGLWGLVGSYGTLFGFTSAGDLLVVDQSTGATTVLKSGLIPVSGAAGPPQNA